MRGESVPNCDECRAEFEIAPGSERI